jgi:hypothetical protein
MPLRQAAEHLLRVRQVRVEVHLLRRHGRGVEDTVHGRE